MLENVLGQPEVTKLREINVQVTEPPMYKLIPWKNTKSVNQVK